MRANEVNEIAVILNPLGHCARRFPPSGVGAMIEQGEGVQAGQGGWMGRPEGTPAWCGEASAQATPMGSAVRGLPSPTTAHPSAA